MAADTVTSTSGAVNDSVTTAATSVFDRYSWVGLLEVHGPTALQVTISTYRSFSVW